MLVCVRAHIRTHTHTPSCVGTRMRLPQGLRSCAPSVALRGLKPICLSAAQNADRQTSTRLTQCWDWNGAGVGLDGDGGAAGGAEARPNGVLGWRRWEGRRGEADEDRRLSACICTSLDVLVRAASYGLTSAGLSLIAGPGVKWDSGKCSHVLLCSRLTEMFVCQMQYADSDEQLDFAPVLIFQYARAVTASFQSLEVGVIAKQILS